MTLAYSFAELTNTKFIDWEETESPSDAAGFILTGYTTANDASVEKQSPYITTYLTRTEENVEEIDGELVPMKQSGCKLQSQWSWANSVASKKWSPEFEVYRYKRPRFIEDAEDDFDTGFKIVTSKSKLRGRGKALSLLFKTVPEKDCHLLGWSLQLTGNNL